MRFEDVLKADPGLKRVGFYYLNCPEHGVFRMLANGVVPDRCPRCGLPAKLVRSRSLRCATRRPVPYLQRWKSDNLSATFERSLARPETEPVEEIT
jgi:hypothetical protein